MQGLVSFIKQFRITFNDASEVIDDCEDTDSKCDAEDENGLDERRSDLLKDLRFRTLCLMDLVPTLETLAGRKRRRKVQAPDSSGSGMPMTTKLPESGTTRSRCKGGLLKLSDKSGTQRSKIRILVCLYSQMNELTDEEPVPVECRCHQPSISVKFDDAVDNVINI